MRAAALSGKNTLWISGSAKRASTKTLPLTQRFFLLRAGAVVCAERLVTALGSMEKEFHSNGRQALMQASRRRLINVEPQAWTGLLEQALQRRSSDQSKPVVFFHLEAAATYLCEALVWPASF